VSAKESIAIPFLSGDPRAYEQAEEEGARANAGNDANRAKSLKGR
jgi:hypothetical protein